ncbi:hypothetical protein BBO_09198 [Beauveria brongniartii RCEF 3172]|uniref:Uncharacterized protein n=1 Tax=Beauveria brongniartii RCEF 3172 TaxID=1081107 RepID=A0A166W7M6_9HYPO|nr:hypothetical protein BBO_09198 [Beauveria brongniartii RCEF 3172]
MESETVQHAYFAGRSAKGLPQGGHSAILEIIFRTPFKKPFTGEVQPKEMPEPEFRLIKTPHTLQACEYLLQTAEEFSCFEGIERVLGRPATFHLHRLQIYAFLAGVLLPDIPYEDSLAVDTLAAVFKAGIVQRSEAVAIPDRCKLLLAGVETYINQIIWNEGIFENFKENKGSFQVPGPDVIYFDGTPSSEATS